MERRKMEQRLRKLEEKIEKKCNTNCPMIYLHAKSGYCIDCIVAKWEEDAEELRRNLERKKNE